MRKYLLLILFMSLQMVARGQTADILGSFDFPQPTTAKSMRYWFDEDAGSAMTVETVNGKHILDVKSLQSGLHTLHCQLIDTEDNLAVPYSTLFLVQKGTNAKASTLRYWFDDATDVTTCDANAGVQALDVSALLDGLHTVHYQTVDAEGTVSYIASNIFLKNTAPTTVAQNLKYWFDDETDVRVADVTGGTQTLDVSNLLAGIHTLHYQITDDNGNETPPVSGLFLKMYDQSLAEGKNVITQYRYWLNDNSKDIKKVEIDKPTSPYQLITLLPTDKHPIRSSCFHFETKSGEPMIYAKNSLHIRFEDAVGYWLEDSCTFVDNRVSQTVSDIDHLMTTQTFARVNNDSIKWYKFEAEKGDSLKFKMSQTCTVQLFSPDGTELFSAKGDKSVAWGGCHTQENGMHYVAVHDVIGAKPDVTLLFRHLDYADIYVSKDALLSQETIKEDSVLSQKPSVMLYYDSDDTSLRGHLTVESDATLSLGRYTQTGALGYYNNTDMFKKPGTEYYHPTTLVSEGFVRADSVMVKEGFYRDKWHFISFPFNVRMSDIRMPHGTYCAIRTYDGEQRAQGNSNNVWKNVDRNGILEANRGYILQLTSEYSDKSVELTFPAINDTKKNGLFCSDDSEQTLSDYPAEFPHNRSWNLIGNPYPCFYDTQYMDMTGTITVWNGKGYTAYSLMDDHYILMPFEAFFVQKPVNADKVVFSAEGRQHTASVREQPARSKKYETFPTQDRQIFNLCLSDGNFTDQTRIVLNDKASLEYESDKDAVKFMEPQPNVPQLYSLEGSVRYAINERPSDGGSVSLTVYVPEDGMYSISLKDKKGGAKLLDTENMARTVLNEEDYSFYALKGTHEGRFRLILNDTPTSIENMVDPAEGEMCVVGRTLSFNFTNQHDIKVYGVDGTMYYDQTSRCGQISLDDGVFIVEINGKARKIIIKE